MMSLRRSFFLAVACSAVFALHAAAATATQEELAALSASGLLTEATKNLSQENYGSAIPYLKEYLERMKGDGDVRVLAMMQEVRLKLGKIMAYSEDSLSAIDYLQQYIETLPCYKPREALKLLSVNLYNAGLYDQCISAVTNALTEPPPRVLKREEKARDYNEMSKDELGGLTVRKLKRLDKELAETKEISSDFPDDAPEPEPNYTVEELVLLNLTLGDACAELKNWQGCLAPYQFVTENATDESRKGYAILQTVNALIGLERYKDAGTFVIQLYRSNARYDIRVNMALMKIAAVLFDRGEPDSALVLYRMVLPRRELVAYQEGKMNAIRREAGLPSVDIKIVTNETGRVETLFGNKITDLSLPGAQTTFAADQTLPAKPPALIQLEELTTTLVSLPAYENEVLYRTGQVYAETGRSWEAVAALNLVALRDPDGELGQRAFAESLLVLVDPLEEYARVETLATQFLAAYTDGLGPRMVAHALTSCYQKQERWKDIKKILPVIKQFIPSDSKTVRQYECELYYMQAIADLMLFNYDQALAGFAGILTDFPDSHQQENATHWHAMTQTFLKNYEKALAEFNSYSATYPHGAWMPETAFHSGICLFGLDRLEEAQQRFTEVINTWPDSSVFPDACSLRGDILASKGLLTEAQRDYEAAIAKARTPKQDSYAVFQMVSMFELEARYPEMINVVQAYLARQGEEADVAKAAYWIGKIKLAQGLTDEAVAAYRDAIIKYGGNILQDGVDLIITELSKVAKKLEAAPRQKLEESLQTAIDATDNQTLKLRLRVLLAKINGTEIELGKELITELDDLTQAPPPVLAIICKASFAASDYSRAQEILNIFQTRYEDSDFMRDAYKLRAYDLYAAGDMDAAAKIVEETQAIYGWQQDVVWAQLMKGRIALQRGNFDTAREAFREVLKVREWRGAPYAEATYRLGEVEEKAGDPRKAFAWYQRAYFQYKGYAQGRWAADAYLASARCLQALGLENDWRNTYRAMLFDTYVNQLPQADVARQALGREEVSEINLLMAQGVQTNFTVTVDAEGTEE